MEELKIPLLVILGMAVISFVFIKFGLAYQEKLKIKVEEEMKSFLNLTKEDLLKKKGAPTTIFKIDDRNELWTYITIKSNQSYNRPKSGRDALNQLNMQYEVKREFFIDENGIIYNYRWENL